MTLMNMDKFLSILLSTFLIGFVVLAVFIIFVVILQRGEEGIFAKNHGDKSMTNDKSMMRMTILSSLCFFFLAIALNSLIHHKKHKAYREQNLMVKQEESLQDTKKKL